METVAEFDAPSPDRREINRLQLRIAQLEQMLDPSRTYLAIIAAENEVVVAAKAWRAWTPNTVVAAPGDPHINLEIAVDALLALEGALKAAS